MTLKGDAVATATLRDQTISVRMTSAEKDLVDAFSRMHGESPSSLIRRSVLERIEDELDLEEFERAKAEWDADPHGYTLDEVRALLGL